MMTVHTIATFDACPGQFHQNPMGTHICQNENGKSTSDNANGNGYFFMCAKIPVGRLDANAIQ